jgi:hypothetical protein
MKGKAYSEPTLTHSPSLIRNTSRRNSIRISRSTLETFPPPFVERDETDESDLSSVGECWSVSSRSLGL